MAFFRQIWALCCKNLLIVGWRQWFPTLLRVAIMPIALMIFLAECRNFFTPPRTYGIGSPNPVRDLLTEVFPSPAGGRSRVVLSDNSANDAQVAQLINSIAGPLRNAGAEVLVLDGTSNIAENCQPSLLGPSRCFAAASFDSSPTIASDTWIYTVYGDYSLGFMLNVHKDNNDAQTIILPFVHYIDKQIANLTGVPFPNTVEEIPFTYQNNTFYQDQAQEQYADGLVNFLSAAFYIAICGITFHLPGFIAAERELGISQLIDSMATTRRPILSQIARLFAAHLAFDIIYMPAWLALGAIASTMVFRWTSVAIVLPLHILAGLALCSYATLGASFFRKAQLSGITVMIISIAVAVVVQLAPISSATGLYVLAFLFPSAAYVLCLIDIAAYEAVGKAAQFGTRWTNSQRYTWEVTLPEYICFIALIVQIIVFPIIAVLIERLRFGIAAKGRHVRRTPGATEAAIKLTNFSKHYNTGIFKRKRLVKAVNNLDLTVLHGETMVLLGANGSGKSTTLDTISGLISLTDGSIEIDGSGGIGLCPQKNVIWHNLTVREHVWIFDQLKANARASSKAELDSLIRGCDLAGKSKKRAGALSGGQKRKLQLAMAFAGGSRVCCIDEVSSGLDPVSRRKIWEILIQERGTRTFLLTTHALDEADALADHVTIMSKGHLKVQGSVVELKSAHGGGYRVHVAGGVDPALAHGVDATHIRSGGETVFQVATSADALQIVDRLKQSGVQDYQVIGPTIEDVFLQVAEEGKDELADTPSTSPSSSVKNDAGGAEGGVLGAGLGKSTGKSMLGQTWVLYKKRGRVLSRNYVPYICVVGIPLIVAGLTTYFLGGFSRLICASTDIASLNYYEDIGQVAFNGAVRIGPSNQFQASRYPESFDSTGRYSSREVRLPAVTVDTYSQWVNFFNPEINRSRRGKFAGIWLGDSSGATPILAYPLQGGVYNAVWAKQIMDSYILGTPINIRYSTFRVPSLGDVGDSWQLIIYLGLAFSVYPAFFALYPTFERLRMIRALHYSNGIRPGSLWLAYGLFDLPFVAVISAATVGILVSTANVWYDPGHLFVVLLFYGMSSAYFSYFVSIFASTQLAAFAFSAGPQAIFVLANFAAYLGLLSFSVPDLLKTNLNIVQFTLNLITPSGNLLRSLLLTMNQSQLLCANNGSFMYAGSITAFGGPILYLILQILAFYVFLVLWDNDWKPHLLFWKKKHTSNDREKMAGISVQEVATEVARTEASKDPLRVLHLNKSFGKEVAVEDLTFGVQRGEVFALLGPNGAGKSTTISLIRGDIRPSTKTSEIFVEDTSAISNRSMARHNLGVCPQFDAIDRMTVYEHLSFYAQACGVHKSDVARNVNAVIIATGLEPFRDRMADDLSGGNKRKLSLGISIIGNPSVLLLDEPSSGMDAVSKRIMWKLLRVVKEGRSLVLTTHSMEEASALGDRAGIMAKRMLAVGTTSDLRAAHGNGYYVHLHLTDQAAGSSAAAHARIAAWMAEHVPHAVSIGGGNPNAVLLSQLRYHVPTAAPYTGATPSPTTYSVSMTDMLRLLEQHKESLSIGFYSVSPTTLEDVFLNMIGGRSVEDEEYSDVKESEDSDGQEKRAGAFTVAPVTSRTSV